MDRSFILRTAQDRGQATAYVASLSTEPVMEVTIRPYKSKRSVEQNRMYWGVWLKHISDHTGHSPEELHEFFKQRFLHHEDLTVLGDEVQVYPSTTKLNTKQFTEYLDKVSLFAQQELGCYLPAMEE